MAQIYLKNLNADQTVILDPREGMLRETAFETNWNEVRIGLYFSGIAITGPENAPLATGEQLSSATFEDQFTFGLKDPSTILPGTTGSYFLGAATGNNLYTSTNAGKAFSVCASAGGSSQGTLAATGWAGATIIDGTNTLANFAYPAPGGASGYCAFYALKFVVANAGLSSQTVTISAVNTSPAAGADYSLPTLRSAAANGLVNATYANARSLAWNTGVAARTLPDCIWLRVPLYLNRIRVSAIAGLKIS